MILTILKIYTMLMITIDLKDFGPILSSKESGQQIYDLIIKAKPREIK